MISERLFAVIDQDNNEYLDIQEFINGLSKLFDDCYDNQINFIFKFYDFNRDGFISREDINVVLCYLPLNCPKIANMMNFKYEKEEFDMRIESQEEIHKINWNVYGKIKSIVRMASSLKKNLIFDYDALQRTPVNYNFLVRIFEINTKSTS